MSLEKHHFTGGITGSGKTVFASNLFGKSKRLAIYINTNNEVIPEQKADIVFHDIEGFCKAINEYKRARHLCLSPTTERDIEIRDIEKIIILLFEMGKKYNENRIEPIIWCELYIDEIQEYEGKRQHNKYIQRVWKRGRRHGIIGVAISQRPADVSHTVLTQSHVHYIFDLSGYEKAYFQAYGIPMFEEDVMEWIRQDFHYVKYEKGVITKYEPIIP